RLQAAAAIAGNRQQPRRELSPVVPVCQTSQRSSEGLLSHVLRILAVPKHAITKTEDLAPELVDKVSHGGLVPPQASPNQLAHFVGQLNTSAGRSSSRHKRIPREARGGFTPIAAFLSGWPRKGTRSLSRSRPERCPPVRRATRLPAA